ncbi:DNA-directed RNA polymerase III subunit Rpc5 [Cryomyces antarcticus]
MAPARFPVVDDDPVTAEYDVFITPDLEEQIYLLQYPNRGYKQPYNEAAFQKPLDMRIKPKAGFIEMDVPMHVWANFDKKKGVEWGEAMRKAKDDGSSGFGLAAGFDGGAPPLKRSGRATADQNEDGSPEADVEHLLRRFDDANDKGHVMNKQTLGGQILKDEAGKPIYMLGAFRGKELHLTKVDGIVQMRPQFHHIDALTRVDRATTRREREAAEPPRTTEPRAVHQTIKSTTEGDASNNQENAAAFLRAAHEEPWTKMKYHDEDTDAAYAAYHERLFVADIEAAPKLKSSMTNEQYLDAISAPRVDPSGRSKKKPLTKKQMAAIDLAEDESDVPGAEQAGPAGTAEGQAEAGAEQRDHGA